VTEEREHLVEELAGHALGALDAPERERVERHVATCASCAGRLAEYRAVVGALAAGLEPVEPPAEAWAAIRAGAATGSRRAPRWARLRAARWPAVAAVVAGLLVWNVLLERELARRAPGPDPGPDVEALARRPGRVVILTGTGAPGASARLFVAADGGHGHLAITGVTPLPAGRTYQLWFERVGAPAVTGGAFRVAARGLAWVSVAVPLPLEEVRAITVTEEPAPGSAIPTGRRLLDARP
jgi:anti-sigma factor RsiW